MPKVCQDLLPLALFWLSLRQKCINPRPVLLIVFLDNVSIDLFTLEPLLMFLAMFSNRNWQIPAQRATATNNQELPKTFRNLDSESALSQFAALQNACNCNKRMHQNAKLQNGGRRCSRRMAHSDIGEAVDAVAITKATIDN